MILRPEDIDELVKSNANNLKSNHELIDIYENNLSSYVLEDLSRQLSPKSFNQIKHRVASINILPKVVDKLTNIYQGSVVRSVFDGNENDKFLLDFYSDSFEINSNMDTANELLNLCRTSLVYITIKDGMPRLIPIRNDRAVVYAKDPEDPTKPTHIILVNKEIDGAKIYYTWSDDEFIITDSNHKIRRDLMAGIGNPEGLNPYGKLPFVYVNDSKFSCMPEPDIDGMRIVKLIPVMLSDLNLAAMFQCFSIIYTVNMDNANLELGPNILINLKSDPTTDHNPSIGTIKPEVDYDQVLKLIETELSMWLGTKGIRASSVGSASPDNFASGISKIIDEMDTYEARQKQVALYKKAESELWDLVLNYMHPYWVSSNMIQLPLVSPNAYVNTEFAVQLPIQSRGNTVRDLKDEYMAGFISRKRVVAKLNQEMTEEEIDELLLEIDEERSGAMEFNVSNDVNTDQNIAE